MGTRLKSVEDTVQKLAVSWPLSQGLRKSGTCVRLRAMDRSRDDSQFQTTLWSVVLRAGSADAAPKHAALSELCRLYWKPLLVFCLGRGHQREDAEDLTQAFFAHLLAHDTLRVADPDRGRFRGFLLTSFKRFMADDADFRRAAKRGGGSVHLSFEVECHASDLLPPSAEISPERAYDRQWANDLVARATAALQAEAVASGKAQWFERVAGPDSGAAYAEVAAELATSEDAVKSFAKRTRRRFRELLEREIADTVGSPEEAAEELAYLVELLRG
jgi:RNA polymerase sigma-70 factor (ECF subfamily)